MDVESKIIIARGAGPFTTQELQDMLDCRGWERFQRRIDLLIETWREACENAVTPDEWRKAQGALEALRRSKLMPDEMLAELKKGK